MNRVFIFVQVFYKLDDPPFVFKQTSLSHTFIGNGYFKPFVKKGHFPQPVRKGVKAKLRIFKYFTVRPEGDLCPALFCLSHNGQWAYRVSALITLLLNAPVS